MNSLIVEKGTEALFLTNGCRTTELLLIRHAARSSALDDEDCELPPAERELARRLGQDLGARRVPAVYSAPTSPCRETAQVLSDEACCEVEIVTDLSPIHIDPSEAPLVAGEMAMAIEAAAQRICCYPRWDAVPGAENGRLFRRRAIRALEAIAARHQGQVVAIVTHDCVINAYLSMVLDIPRDMFFVPSPASVSSVRVRGDRNGLQCINSKRPPGEIGAATGLTGAEPFTVR